MSRGNAPVRCVAICATSSAYSWWDSRPSRDSQRMTSRSWTQGRTAIVAASEPSRLGTRTRPPLSGDDGLRAQVDVQQLQHAGDGGQPLRVVVVAADDDGGDARAVQLAQEVEEERLRLRRGRRGVEDVAGDEEAVDRLPPGDLQHLVERLLALIAAREGAQVLPEVPVAGVEEPHPEPAARACRVTRGTRAGCRSRRPPPPSGWPRRGRGTGPAAAPGSPAGAGTCCRA